MVLHLTNGESTAELLRETNVPGTVRSGDDILMEGPLPNQLASPNDWIERAGWLEQTLGIDAPEYIGAAQRRHDSILALNEADELVLWFENDVFCQINFTFLLCLTMSHKGPTTFVCPSTDRLGRLDASALAELHRERAPVTPALRALASKAWSALCADTPHSLADLLQHPHVFAAWPALRDGLRAQLRRLPRCDGGLNDIERAILQCVARDVEPAQLFRAVSQSCPVYGFTDMQFDHYMEELKACNPPLIVDDGSHASRSLPGVIETALILSHAGVRALDGEVAIERPATAQIGNWPCAQWCVTTGDAIVNAA